jgi:hypothetical protein
MYNLKYKVFYLNILAQDRGFYGLVNQVFAISLLQRENRKFARHSGASRQVK